MLPEKGTKIKWSVAGAKVCATAFRHVVGLSIYKFKQLVKNCRDGHFQPQEDKRSSAHAQYHRESTQAQHADAWLNWAYWNIAEPLAETEQTCTGMKQADGEEDEQCDEILVNSLEFGGTCLAPRAPRHLPPGRIAELYDLYRTSSLDRCAGSTTFGEVYRASWKKLMPFRAVGHHARCTRCAKLSKMRELARTKEAKDEVAELQREHGQAIYADRAEYARAQRLSAESVRALPGAPESAASMDSVLTITIDGMDQAKFRLPRNLVATKQFEKAWRPQQHMVGTIIAGLMEVYYLLPNDCAQDSNMQLTLLTHTLDKVSEQLQGRGRCMPANLIVQADNTCRETRNQFGLKWAAVLIMKGNFRSVTFQFMQVGHTHVDIDQRFSIVATALSKSEVLETPEDTHQKLDA